jgi:TolA-binding protein
VTETTLEERLRAVERAVTDGEASVAAVADAASVHERLDEFETRLDALEKRTDALDATVQSLHGYVGEIESVNEDVARRADAARAAVERLEEDRQRLEPPSADAATADGDAKPQPSRAAERDGGGPTSSHQPDTGGVLADSDAADVGRAHESDGDESLLDRVRESL